MSAQAPESPDAATGTFRPLESSRRQGHGPRALLLCGLPAEARDAIAVALATLALEPPPALIAVAAAQTELTLERLAAGAAPESSLPPLPDAPARDAPALPPAIVFSGLREDELGAIMTACRQQALPPVLWAMVTPTNATWTARALITELAREREALRSAFATATTSSKETP